MTQINTVGRNSHLPARRRYRTLHALSHYLRRIMDKRTQPTLIACTAMLAVHGASGVSHVHAQVPLAEPVESKPLLLVPSLARLRAGEG